MHVTFIRSKVAWPGAAFAQLSDRLKLWALPSTQLARACKETIEEASDLPREGRRGNKLWRRGGEVVVGPRQCGRKQSVTPGGVGGRGRGGDLHEPPFGRTLTL